MAQNLSELAQIKADEMTKTPQIVLEIEGVSTVYGAIPVKTYIKIGDPGLVIGSGWKIGGLTEMAGSEALISMGTGGGGGTSTEIRQTIEPDKGRGSTVTSLNVALIDQAQKITKLITPGEIVDDILGRRCKLWLGFDDTSFKEDFFVIHRGIIDDISAKAGVVILTIANAEQKKRQQIYQKVDAELDGAITNAQTTITLASTANLLVPSTGPNGLNDSTLKFYVRIDDEIIRYAGITGNNLTGCTRAQLGTLAAAHDDEAATTSFYRLEGNIIDVILKMYLSGWNGYNSTTVPITHIGYTDPITPVANAIYFEGVDLERDYGLVDGDYVTIASSGVGGNNVTLKTIGSITVTDLGSYCVINETMTGELVSPATASFRSQYDTLGQNAGLKLHPDEVDIAQHLYLQSYFLSQFSIDLYIKDTIDAKEWIEQNLLAPAGAYSIPRKARISLGMTVGPIPNANIKELNQDNIKSPASLTIRRAISRYFYNTVVFRYDEDALEDKYLSGYIDTNATSRTQIPVGSKTLVLDAKGVRSALSGAAIAAQSTTRRLNRYAFSAEFLEQVKVHFGVGLNVDVGDVLILNGEGLYLADTKTASRDFEPRYFEVINKITNIKTGDISFQLLDTGFSTQNRYALISPSSVVRTGTSTTRFTIESDGFYSMWGNNEGKKWANIKHANIIVRALDFSVVSSATIQNVVNNEVFLSTPLAFIPSAGQIMELDVYDTATDSTKLLYACMRDTDPFADGKNRYQMF